MDKYRRRICEIIKYGGYLTETVNPYAQEAQSLYKGLTQAEKKAFDVYLKNGNRTLENLTENDLLELKRLRSARNSKTSPTDNVILDRKENRHYYQK